LDQSGFRQIIDDLGGYRQVAEDFANFYDVELHPTTVFKWARDGIPSSRFAKIVDLAGRKKVPDITLDLLHELREKATGA
jgi:hypothetical protein